MCLYSIKVLSFVFEEHYVIHFIAAAFPRKILPACLIHGLCLLTDVYVLSVCSRVVLPCSVEEVRIVVFII